MKRIKYRIYEIWQQFKCLLVTNLRSEDVFLKPHMMYMREYDLMENLAEIDDGGCDDLDFANSVCCRP
jgi:hypothetical protein